eukprot:scaffold101906_cov20-Tisochrysis_lutea.AAC.3
MCQWPNATEFLLHQHPQYASPGHTKQRSRDSPHLWQLHEMEILILVQDCKKVTNMKLFKGMHGLTCVCVCVILHEDKIKHAGVHAFVEKNEANRYEGTAQRGDAVLMQA